MSSSLVFAVLLFVSLTVLGVTFGVDAGTFFEDGTPVVGDYVEVEDDNGDGTADSVEIED